MSRCSRSAIPAPKAALLVALVAAALACADRAVGQTTQITVVDAVHLYFDEAFGEQRVPVDGGVVGPAERHAEGRAVDVAVTVPTLPRNLERAMGIRATLRIEPVMVEDAADPAGAMRPSDPWTRIGRVSIVLPEDPATQTADGRARDQADDPGDAGTETQSNNGDNTDDPAATTIPDPGADAPDPQVELIRFTTPFGGPATYEADLTAFAPLLDGDVTLRIFIDTYTNPGWQATLTIRYDPALIAYRRPAFARSIIRPTPVTAVDPVRTATVNIPEGLALPRMRILSTGHSVDGRPGDEFISRTHILRIDGEEVARWRPWREGHAGLRELNPTSGRGRLGSRTVWSTDFDRSGWLPGMRVEPLVLPLPELTPGPHEVEIEVVDIRPVDEESGGYGYWWLSAVIVADEPWPDAAESPAP